MRFKSKFSAVAATAIVAVWTISAVVIDSHHNWHSTPGIWTVLLGMPGVVVGMWIQIYQSDQSRLGIVVLSAIAATNWLFWFSVAKIIAAIRHKLFGT